MQLRIPAICVPVLLRSYTGSYAGRFLCYWNIHTVASYLSAATIGKHKRDQPAAPHSTHTRNDPIRSHVKLEIDGVLSLSLSLSLSTSVLLRIWEERSVQEKVKKDDEPLLYNTPATAFLLERENIGSLSLSLSFSFFLKTLTRILNRCAGCRPARRSRNVCNLYIRSVYSILLSKNGEKRLRNREETNYRRVYFFPRLPFLTLMDSPLNPQRLCTLEKFTLTVRLFGWI